MINKIKEEVKFLEGRIKEHSTNLELLKKLEEMESEFSLPGIKSEVRRAKDHLTCLNQRFKIECAKLKLLTKEDTVKKKSKKQKRKTKKKKPSKKKRK